MSSGEPVGGEMLPGRRGSLIHQWTTEHNAQRALARRGRATIVKKRLGEADDDVSSGAEAVALVHKLTLAAWAWSNQPLPTLARSELPIRFLRGKRT